MRGPLVKLVIGLVACDLVVRIRFHNPRQQGPKVYSLHAPEVECIGRGKARAP